MNNIQIQVKNDTMLVTSLEVAEKFGKEHKNVLRDINNLVAQNGAAKSMFIESTYKNRGKNYLMYLMNRDGFMLLVMGFTGKEAMNIKLAFIDAFNKMEEAIKQKHLEIGQATKIKAMNAEARLINARVRTANGLLQIADRAHELNAKSYEQVCLAHAGNIYAGKEILELPQAPSEKHYTATEVGEKLGISAAMVGRIANAHSIKTDEFGHFYYDKSRYSNKEVTTFKYNEKGISEIKKYL